MLRLTKKEELIMGILWQSETPLAVSEIYAQIADQTTQNTVQTLLRTMEGKGVIAVGGIKQISKALARAYVPAITPEKYAISQYKRYFKETKKEANFQNLVSTLLKNETYKESDIAYLEKMIAEIKADRNKEEGDGT